MNQLDLEQSEGMNLVPLGLPVRFSHFAVPCRSITRIARSDDGIGVRVHMNDNSVFDDPKTTFSDAITAWEEAVRNS